MEASSLQARYNYRWRFTRIHSKRCQRHCLGSWDLESTKDRSSRLKSLTLCSGGAPKAKSEEILTGISGRVQLGFMGLPQ